VETNLAGSYRAGITYNNQVLIYNEVSIGCQLLTVPLQGRHALVIDNPEPQLGAIPNTNLNRYSVAVSQRGDIPPEAGRMTFRSSSRVFSSLAIDGTALPFCNVPDCDFFEVPYYREVDVSQWAGKTVTLYFTSLGIAVIDDIKFIQAEPQPPIVTGKASTNQFALSWPAQRDYYFQIEVATNLPPVWQALAGTVITTGGISQFVERFSDTNQATEQRYYRLRAILRELP
jgi:hypothetical protein